MDLYQQLKDKQLQLMSRISAIKGDFLKGRSADFAEQATESENDDVLKEIQRQAEQELRWVNTALQRLDNGTYQQCSRCGEAISQARLAALPYTTECIACASK